LKIIGVNSSALDFALKDPANEGFQRMIYNLLSWVHNGDVIFFKKWIIIYIIVFK